MNNSGKVKELNKFRHKIALIVPTRNRLQILTRLLNSIKEQTVLPDQVIIVDGSDQPIENELKPFLNSIISYIRVFPPGLTRQRNEGRKALREDITLVVYLDDDIVMEKEAIEAMLKFWETAPEDMGGASFNIINSPPNKPNFLTKLFLINNDKKGKILRSGCNTAVAPVLKDIFTQWLCGGATIWNRKVFKEFNYDEWYRGYAYLEDADFSYSVSKKYKLAVIHSARIQHLPPPLKPQKVNSYIKTHVIQQYYFVKKHPELSLLQFYWSIFGLILISALLGITRLRLESFHSAAGYIAGLASVIAGKLKQVDESFREEKLNF